VGLEPRFEKSSRHGTERATPQAAARDEKIGEPRIIAAARHPRSEQQRRADDLGEQIAACELLI
jgi:hypothetical protein